MHEEDFVLIDEVEFEIEGKKFTYKPVTAGDELKWVQEYIEIIDGKAIQNFEKKTICKLRNILKVPYKKETINKIIQIDQGWENLNKDQRWKFLSKLKPALFDKIITKINKIDSSENQELKKN
jgi:hypothetical protein